MVNNYSIEEWLRYRFDTKYQKTHAFGYHVHTRLTIRNANLYAKIYDEWEKRNIKEKKHEFSAQSTDIAYFNY